MANNVEEHILKLRDDFSRKLSGIDSKVNKFRGGIVETQGSIKGLGALATRVFAGIAVGAAVKQVASLGIEMEQTRVAFATFLGDADKGNKLISQLNEFANITPFNNAEVIKSGRLLLAAGIEAENITSQLKDVGDVAAGANVPITELAAIFQKATTKGKLQGEELNQFAERGIPIIAELAEMFNISTAEVFKMGEKGQITADVMNQAFRNMTSEGGIFFNLMEKQSQTVGGRISTFIGKLQLIGIEIGEKLLPVFGRFVDIGLDLVNTLAENTDAIITLFKWAVKIGGAFVIYKTALIGANLALKVARVATIAYRVAVVAMNRGIISAVRSLKALKVGLASTGLGLLAIALAEIASSFIDFGDDIEGATGKLDEFGNKVKEINNIEGKRIFDKLLGPTFDEIAGTIIEPTLGQFTESLKGLQTGDLGLLQQFLEDRIPELERDIVNLTGVEQIVSQQRLAKLQEALKLLGVESAKTGKTTITGAGAGEKLKSGLATVRSGAPKNITINIESLIEEQTFNTGDLKESAARIKDTVTRVILEALNDAQVIAR